MPDQISQDTLLRHARREAAMASVDAALACLVTCPHCGGDLAPFQPATAGDHPIPTPVSHAQAALAIAEAEWRRRVIEPPAGGAAGTARIVGYISEVGWGAQVNVKEPGKPYRNGGFAWCGCFWGWCYLQTGFWPELHSPALLKRYGKRNLLVVSSTSRLVEWAHGTPRLLKPKDAQPGDGVIVGPRGGNWCGEHVTMAAEIRPNGIVTWEGNATGEGPDGQRYEGVVKGFRPFTSTNPDTYCVMHVIRPMAADFKERVAR